MSEIHDEDGALEPLLDYLHAARGVDFSGYKRNSLRRRIHRRVKALGMGEDLRAYREHLSEHTDELAMLFDSIFINVTSFFRDAEAWSYVAEHVIPAITRGKSAKQAIRVWSAGCASGEEPFTVAMLLAEELGPDQFARRVKLYATDWDEAALVQARRARYDSSALESVPEALRRKYFQLEDDSAVLHGALRRSVIFGRHDLMEDAPISRVDLLLCRNTIMYFNVDTQARVLSRFHFALEEHGFLFLGRAEMLLSHSHSFSPVELKHRVFVKVPFDLARGDGRPLPSRQNRRGDDDSARTHRLREAALDASPVAQIALDGQGRIGVINNEATLLFNLGPSDLGRPIQDVEPSYRPVDLRSMIDESQASSRSVTRKNVEYRNHGPETQHFDVAITPFSRDGALLATTITFSDVSHHHKLQENLQRFSENLETAYEEVQSANEELETTNEELQAANEEMETVNEELRSTNEELQAVNDRLRQHEDELNQSNAFLNAILASLRAGLAVLGDDLTIRVWNELAADLWGVRAHEARGRMFSELDIGLPVATLVEPMRDILAQPDNPRQSRELVLEAINRKGRRFQCRVVVTRLTPESGIANGVCILMEDFASGADAASGGGAE